MEELLGAVSTVGFPIAVSCYLLYQNAKKDKEQVQAVKEQTIVLAELKSLIETLVK
jgi:hypothetical protein